MKPDMLRQFLPWATRLLLIAISGAIAIAGMSAPASAEDVPEGSLVSEVPANGTPHVLDGRVYSVVKIGNTVVLGGTFTSARNNSSSTTIARSRVLAFDATTGVISNSFAPNPNGTVNVVLPTGDGQTVFVAGSFSSIGGVSVSNLAKVRISDGSVVTSFNPGAITGQIKDLRIANGQLWVAGGFTHVKGTAQKALATLNPNTGALTNFFRGAIAGVHNSGYTTVTKIDTNPQEDRLVAIGNFDTLNGDKNRQLFVLNTDGATATAAALRTKFYETRCATAFDSYMRDVDVSPNGKYFVVSTTGAYGGSATACDTTARFDFDNTGDDVRPSWINTTGGDTTYGVEVTDRVVYVGGHQRWQNNSFAGDTPGPGAVARPGVAALDPVNGLPYSWNPTRTRGVGLFDFLMTPQGLWATSDTDRFGQAYLYRGRVALLPTTGGSSIPAMKEQHLPNDVYLAGLTGAATDPGVLYRVNAAGAEIAANTGIDWSANTAGNPSPYVNGGNNRAGYGQVPAVDSSVPSSTPLGIFSNELWDAAGGEEMHWSFPVPTGTELEVRLYFANRYSGTSQVGQRVFNVDVDGARVLNNYDIVADVGHDRGVMKSFDVTSDGQVDIDFGHVTENPLVNGIEILLQDAPPATTTKVLKRTFDGTTAGAAVPVAPGSVDWDSVRGAFMLNGEVYMALSNGNFVRRSFDGTTWGPAESVNEQDQLVVLQDWRSDASNMTGMFFDFGRIYFTVSGSNQLYYRYFNPESKVVGAVRYTASGSVQGVDYSTVRGMFLADGKLYWRTSNGDLRKADWQRGFLSGSAVGGTASLVSGPSNGGASWDARAPFVFQDEDGIGAPLPPTASFVADCVSLTCGLDASGSTSPGTTITAYEWTFGDGTTATGKTVSKTFSGNGTYSAELKVTTAKGGVSTTSQMLTVLRANEPPTAAFSHSCDERTCTFNSSASMDDDGIDSRTWDFGEGDGPESGGVSVTHTFGSTGSFDVTLTVQDTDGVSDSLTKEIEVSDAPAPAVEFVGGRSTNGNRINHSVGLPNGVAVGDRLVLFMTANSSSATIVGPTGWAEIEGADAAGAQGKTWTKVATASDIGTPVTVTSSAYVKSDLSVVAYRGATTTPTVVDSAVNTDRGTAVMTSPTLTAGANNLLVNYWGVKASSAVTISLPGPQVMRTSSGGTGSGAASGWVSDGGSFVSPGPVGGESATFDASVNRTFGVSILLGTS